MKSKHWNPSKRIPSIARVLAACFVTVVGLSAEAAGSMSAELQARLEKAKKLLVERAADPGIVAATREANTQGPGGMNNGKWIDLEDGAPPVKAMLATKTSRQIAAWEQADNSVNKIVLRDEKGNLVAASARPLIFNNANRPVFAKAIGGQPWVAGEVKPDPTTQIPSVHVAAPVMDGGKAIGVLHAGVTAD